MEVWGTVRSAKQPVRSFPLQVEIPREADAPVVPRPLFFFLSPSALQFGRMVQTLARLAGSGPEWSRTSSTRKIRAPTRRGSEEMGEGPETARGRDSARIPRPRTKFKSGMGQEVSSFLV